MPRRNRRAAIGRPGGQTTKATWLFAVTFGNPRWSRVSPADARHTIRQIREIAVVRDIVPGRRQAVDRQRDRHPGKQHQHPVPGDKPCQACEHGEMCPPWRRAGDLTAARRVAARGPEAVPLFLKIGYFGLILSDLTIPWDRRFVGFTIQLYLNCSVWLHRG